MRKLLILYIIITLLLVCISTISAEDKIVILKDQISALEKQKSQLDTERQSFVNQGDELSNKIEEQKAQSNIGLGIIGKYRLSQNLRKAQILSQNIQTLDKKIYELDTQIKEKKVLLNKEYESQINSLVQKFNTVSNTEERKPVLAKIKEYQSARDLMNKGEKQKQRRIDIASIEIKDYDSPKEIKEKADLINDVANKTNTKISMLDTRISKLKGELKTRKKMDEFIDEMSFNDRVVRGEIVSKSESLTTGKDTNTPATPETTTLVKTAVDATRADTPPPQVQTVTLIKKVMKSNGVSVGITDTPQNSIADELKALEKQKQELKKELATLNEKASTFRKKADELEKSGKTSETQSAKPKKQSPEDKAQKKS